MNTDGATKILLNLCTVAAIFAAPATTFAQAAPAKKPAAPAAKKPAAPPKPITEVKKEDFRVTVTLPAVFEGTKLTPVSVDPKAWADLTITSLVPHGTSVKKGTRLVQLDLEKLEDQIEALYGHTYTKTLLFTHGIPGGLKGVAPAQEQAWMLEKR